MSVPPGWYLDPRVRGLRRYWDGNQWTDHIAPPPPGPSDGLIVAAYVLAVFLPLIGIILGIVVMAKGRTGAGLTAVLVGVAAIMIYASWLGS